MIRHIRFCGALAVASWHGLREMYYGLALRTVGADHPDSWLIARRYINAKLKVNDFLREWVR